MILLELTVLLLLCAVALGWVARKLKFPYPIALVAGGAVLGLIPRLPQYPFDPQLILVLVLPPILYTAALMTSWTDMKTHARPIGLLAIGLVGATTLAVGAAFKWLVPEVPWAAAFVLGAIVSPPDAVAATAILSRLNIPRRIVTVLEGESLVNDASGLVIYKFAVIAVFTGAFSMVDAGIQFVGIAAGGALIGAALAHLFISIHRRLADPFIETLTSLLIPYVTYLVAESLQLSGVLAVVAAGLVRSRYAPEIVSAATRIIGRPAWQLLVFMLNSMIFMLIGLQMSDAIDRLSAYSLGHLLGLGGVISLVAIAVRFLWVYTAAALPGAWNKRTPDEPAPDRRELFIISWCGMRGIVSIAAVLALPMTLRHGTPFPQRELIVFVTFYVIGVTLVVQGLSLPYLIRRLKVGTDWNSATEFQRVRAAISIAAMEAIEARMKADNVPRVVAESLRAEIADRAAQAVRSMSAGDGHTPQAELVTRLRHEAIRVERQELIRLWRENQISDEVMHHIEELLDYQEAHF